MFIGRMLMNNISVIIFVNKDINQGIATVESIRAFNGISGLNVYVIDNTEGGKLSKWAKNQQDITYIYIDDGPQIFSKIYNSVMLELGIEGDILLVDEGMLITPHCLETMQMILHSEEGIGAVGGMSNGFGGSQARTDLDSYNNAIDIALSKEIVDKKRRTLNLDSAAVLWKRETLNLLGPMDESIENKRTAMLDYCIQATLADWKLMISTECLWWDIRKDRCLEYNNLQTEKLEEKWGMHYFNWIPNTSLINMIDREQQEKFSVLEVGCDCGATLLEVKNSFPQADIYGSELNPNAVKVAAHIAKVLIDNIEEQKLNFNGVKFDYIMFGDVLEHLKNPQATVQFCRTILKENGCIISCIPNLMHVSVMKDLLNGKFEYTETGLLDKTHIHFFTYYEIVKMFQKAGYEIELVGSRGMPLSLDDESFIEKLVGLSTETEKFMYETFQYVVRVRIKNSNYDIDQ